MSDTDIYTKTSAGTDEVRARARKLPQRLRTMLIMVDGTADVAKLRQAAATLGAPDDFLQVLLSAGLIEHRNAASQALQATPAAPPAQPSAATPVRNEAPLPTASEADRFRAAQKFMNDSAVDAMGLRAFFFTLKLEKCYTLADLRQLLPEFAKAVTKGTGPDVGRLLESRARELLG